MSHLARMQTLPYFFYTLLADFLSLSDTFDEHSLLRHHESEPSTASKETSTNRSRIMSNSSHAPPEYVFIYLGAHTNVNYNLVFWQLFLSVLCDQKISVLFCIY